MHEKAGQISEKVRPLNSSIHLMKFYRYDISSHEFYIEGKKELVQQIETLTKLEAQLKRECDKAKRKPDAETLGSHEILERFQELPKMGNEKAFIESSIDEDFDFFVQNSPVQRLVIDFIEFIVLLLCNQIR